jgi:hypothetical protein
LVIPATTPPLFRGGKVSTQSILHDLQAAEEARGFFRKIDRARKKEKDRQRKTERETRREKEREGARQRD